MKPAAADLPVGPPPSRAEDILALLIGSSFVAFGLVLLKIAGLVTGGLAGVALVTSYVTGQPFGILFLALNLPFFLMAQRRLGWAFTLKSLATMLALAGFANVMPGWLILGDARPAFAAIFGGALIGMGVLSLARHRASIGGIGILSMYLQERRGWSAGVVQMTFDVLIVATAFPVVGAEKAVPPSHRSGSERSPMLAMGGRHAHGGGSFAQEAPRHQRGRIYEGLQPANDRLIGDVRRFAYPAPCGARGRVSRRGGRLVQHPLHAQSIGEAVMTTLGRRKRFHGKTALVTGGSSGIGLAAVKMLVEEGARARSPDAMRRNWSLRRPKSVTIP